MDNQSGRLWACQENLWQWKKWLYSVRWPSEEEVHIAKEFNIIAKHLTTFHWICIKRCNLFWTKTPETHAHRIIFTCGGFSESSAGYLSRRKTLESCRSRREAQWGSVNTDLGAPEPQSVVNPGSSPGHSWSGLKHWYSFPTVQREHRGHCELGQASVIVWRTFTYNILLTVKKHNSN